eukprot:13250051-Ditylum_brightwellii.AAC.1
MASWLAELLDVKGAFLNGHFQNGETLCLKDYVWSKASSNLVLDYVKQDKQKMMAMFECNELGTMGKYVGCKVERDLKEQSMKITQPVLLQSCTHENEMDKHSNIPKMLAESGSILKKDDGDKLNNMQHKKYRTGVGKLLHMTRWSRPEMQNSVKEYSKMTRFPTTVHNKAMKRAIQYCLRTPKQGLLLKPNGTWDGTRDFLLKIKGLIDLEYAKDETR